MADISRDLGLPDQTYYAPLETLGALYSYIKHYKLRRSLSEFMVQLVKASEPDLYGAETGFFSCLKTLFNTTTLLYKVKNGSVLYLKTNFSLIWKIEVM